MLGVREYLLLWVCTWICADAQMLPGEIDCRLAPPMYRSICMQLVQFDAMARRNQQLARQNPRPRVAAPRVPGSPWLSPAVPQRSFAPSVEDCMDLRCVCPYFGGNVGAGGVCMLPSGYPLRPAVRKEVRMLTEEERARYNRVIQLMKRNGEYDRYATIHRDVGTASGAHSGPSFLPWHREFLKRVEIAIRLHDPSLAIPYWDSVLDSYLPDPRDSIFWSPMLLGEMDPNGNIVNGPFAGFRTLEGHPFITRKIGADGKLFTEKSINDVVSQNRVENVLAYTAPLAGCPYPVNYQALEYTHGSMHNYVGGDMKPVVTSANDPVFFFLHSFVDYIFEQWRQTKQTRFNRETDFPPDISVCANPQHFSTAAMRPFYNFINKQGLSNAYTDFMYTYAPRPGCSFQFPSCGSIYIFCDLRHGPPHCVSKIKMNGLCSGFEGQDACYGGTCTAGYCRPAPFQQGFQRFARPRHAKRDDGFVRTFDGLMSETHPEDPETRIAVKAATCFNDDPCCSLWSEEGDCSVDKPYMNKFCKRSCGICKDEERNSTGCVDRHFSCEYFKKEGDCSRRRQWMAENCQLSCGWCDIDTQKLCEKVARMSRM